LAPALENNGTPAALMKIAREGYLYVFSAAFLTLAAWLIGWLELSAVFGILTVGFLAFFRDPERIPPGGEGLILSPADGRVVNVVKVAMGPLMEQAETRISIFLSPLDVHINRAPVAGNVDDVQYERGKFFAAYRDEASERNEQNALRLVDSQGRQVSVVQIAGVLARRIVCRVKKGDFLERGARFGMIMFGSRTDLYLPRGSRIDVAEGQRVKGGETIIGRFV
jgi:phosphatidylserine decarboxylase